MNGERKRVKGVYKKGTGSSIAGEGERSTVCDIDHNLPVDIVSTFGVYRNCE